MASFIMVIIAGHSPGDGAYGWGGWLADVLLVTYGDGK